MAELLHEFRRHNADTAYPPIVGGGANSCILHYRDNDQPLDERRPAAGRRRLRVRVLRLRHHPHSAGQRALHAASSAPSTRWCSRRTARRSPACAPAITGTSRTRRRCGSITQGLVKLGLLKGRVAALIRSGAYRRFFMHRTGHWLGLDVHDVGDYKVGDEWRVLEPGMVLTIEPGIYLPAGARGVPKRFRNIGIRIEDDVVVTRRGAGSPHRARAQGRRRDRSADGARLRLSASTACPHCPPALTIDVAIVGGGMVGASLAPALAGTRRAACCWWRACPSAPPAQPSFDERTTALGNASRRIFEGLGVWPAHRAAGRRHPHHSRVGCGALRLRAPGRRRAGRRRIRLRRRPTAPSVRRCGRALRGVPELTLRVPARAARRSRSPPQGVRLQLADAAGRRERVSARLVVAADGAHSQMRAAAGIDAAVEDYEQVAVVANVAADRPQRASPTSASPPPARSPCCRCTMAALAVIWACRPERARAAAGTGRGRLPRRACRRSSAGARGASCAPARRGSYPLQLTRAASTVGDAHGADRQRRAGAAPGRRPGIQSRAARCGDAGRSDRQRWRRCRRDPQLLAALRRVARARSRAAWCASPTRW